MSTLKTNNKQLAARKHEQYNKILTKLYNYIDALIPTERVGIHEDATHAQLQPLLDKARELGYELVKLDIDPEQESLTRVNKDLPKLRKMIKKLSELKKDLLKEWEMMNSDIPKEAQNISQNFYPEYQELEKIEEEIENDPISQCPLKMKELKQAVKKHFQVQNTKQLKQELIEKGYGIPGDFRVKMTWILIYQRFVLGAEAEKESLAPKWEWSVMFGRCIPAKVAQTTPNHDLDELNKQLPKGFGITAHRNLWGEISSFSLWREPQEEKGNLIRHHDCFRLAEWHSSQLITFTTYWRTKLLSSPETRHKKANSPSYLITIAKDYLAYLESEQAKKDLGL